MIIIYFTSLTFRGEKDEQLVLCTRTHTYEVKEAETSNTCLLIPNLKCKDEAFIVGLDGRIIEEVEVKGIYNTYLEVKEISPKLSKLVTILEPSAFKGLGSEKHIDKSTLYDWNRLKSHIQASDAEIESALLDYNITIIDGIN